MISLKAVFVRDLDPHNPADFRVGAPAVTLSGEYRRIAAGTDHFEINVHSLLGGAVEADFPLLQHDAALAQLAHGRHIVTDEEYGAPGAGHLAHLAEALLLEFRIPHGENLVHDQ